MTIIIIMVTVVGGCIARQSTPVVNIGGPAITSALVTDVSAHTHVRPELARLKEIMN
jgi:hypothetical protein